MSGTLSNLLGLAAQGPAMRAALAEEVAELLIERPGDCPAEMRPACEALLARVAREADEDTRARLRARLHADPDLSARILPVPDRALVEAARAGAPLPPRLAHALGVRESLAMEILSDESGHALAAAAKALGVNRAAFSGLALLVWPGGTIAARTQRLDAYDAVSTEEAQRQLRRWTRPDSRAA